MYLIGCITRKYSSIHTRTMQTLNVIIIKSAKYCTLIFENINIIRVNYHYAKFNQKSVIFMG